MCLLQQLQQQLSSSALDPVTLQVRVQYQATSGRPVDFCADGRRMLEVIQQYPVA